VAEIDSQIHSKLIDGLEALGEDPTEYGYTDKMAIYNDNPNLITSSSIDLIEQFGATKVLGKLLLLDICDVLDKITDDLVLDFS